MRVAHIVVLMGLLFGVFRTAPEGFLTPSLLQFRTEIFVPKSSVSRPPSADFTLPDIPIEDICAEEVSSWRKRFDIDGVTVESAEDCRPDNPWDVATSVKGTNNVSMATLHESLFAPDAIEKSEDRDGDGDPDLIEIRLEVMEINGNSPDTDGPVPEFEIAPGVTPGFWAFVPKSRGMATVDFESNVGNRFMRMPGPAIRVEEGDEVRITLENTHYLPHTIHFHGVDHPFKNPSGEGNDGVPIFSEHPVMPGEKKTYWLKPRQAGTMFYHCHVQPQAHILMGLQGMFIVEENRPDNWLQTINIGAGRVRSPSKAVKEEFDREFDLHYLEIDKELNNQIQTFNDPRLISRAVHRRYNVTQRQPDYFTLNGQSFPYTMRDSLLIMEENERYKLRVLNGGSEGLALHVHGHKPTLTHRDGVQLNASQTIQRDVFWIASAQRLDLRIDTTNDGLNGYGPGAWLVHDHREASVTTNGIGPGGGVSLLVYKNYLGEQGLPRSVMGLSGITQFFSEAYYAGDIPVFAGMDAQNFAEPDVSQVHADRDQRFVLFLICSIAFVCAVLASSWVWRKD